MGAVYLVLLLPDITSAACLHRHGDDGSNRGDDDDNRFEPEEPLQLVRPKAISS